jgi:hypothetical protein
MGDPKRFRLTSELIEQRFPDRQARIADVAGGKGQLQSFLRQAGYRNVLSIDRRNRYAKSRKGYRFGLFSFETLERFDLVVGLHADDATDHVVLYGRRWNVPWIVVPCCVRPSGAPFGARANDYHRWIAHLRKLGGGPTVVETITLSMKGRNVALVGNL